MTDRSLLTWPLARLLAEYPYAHDFFSAFNPSTISHDQTVGAFINALPPDQLDVLGLNQQTVVERLLAFIEQMQHLQGNRKRSVHSVTVIGVHDKDGIPEDAQVNLTAGEVIAVVGPRVPAKAYCWPISNAWPRATRHRAAGF